MKGLFEILKILGIVLAALFLGGLLIFLIAVAVVMWAPGLGGLFYGLGFSQGWSLALGTIAAVVLIAAFAGVFGYFGSM